MERGRQRRIVAILRCLKNARGPLGSTHIAEELQAYGIDLSHRTVRYYLGLTDSMGLTRKASGRLGRVITPRGEAELHDALVADKVGLISARMDALAYAMTFAPGRGGGTVVVNVSLVPAVELRRALSLMEPVLARGLGMGRHLLLVPGGGEVGEIGVPRDRAAVGTLCSVIVNGILIHAGIPVTARFGGLLEIEEGRPQRFTEIIHYDGSSIDPLEIFIKGKMTRVLEAARTGRGRIGASFREIPAAALPAFGRLARRLERMGLGAVLAVGRPGRPLLDIPVMEGKVGVVVAGGLNPLAAVEESGIPTENVAMGAMVDFGELVSYETVLQRLNGRPAASS